MAPKNDGKSGEKAFLTWVGTHGVDSAMWRFKDSNDFKGKSMMTTPNPADFAGVLCRESCFVEVKSSTDPVRYPKASAKNPFQRQGGELVTLAGGSYYYFLYSVHLDRSYLIPYKVFWGLKKTNWEELEAYAVTK